MPTSGASFRPTPLLVRSDFVAFQFFADHRAFRVVPLAYGGLSASAFRAASPESLIREVERAPEPVSLAVTAVIKGGL